MEFKYYFFGSADSADTDVLILHPNATGTEQDLELVKSIKSQFAETANWDINIIAIENGIVTKSIPSKGLPDAVNNSLFSTFHLHNQLHPLEVNKLVKRDLENAINRVVDILLFFYKSTEQKKYYKNECRAVLKAKDPIILKLAVLTKFDFDKFRPYSDDEKNINSLKKIAFSIGQAISLIEGIEIYSKQNLIKNHPELADLIYRRKVDDYSILNTKLNELVDKIKKNTKNSIA